MIGGSCPNVACLPSKNVIYSAKAVSLLDPQHGLGVVTGSTAVDMAGVARRKRKMVEGLIEMHLANFKASGAELVMGEARFTEPKTFEVRLNAGGTRQLRGERVFLNLGSRAAIPNVPGLADARPLTHVQRSTSNGCPSIWSSSAADMSARSSPRRCVASVAASRSCSGPNSCSIGKMPTSPTRWPS